MHVVTGPDVDRHMWCTAERWLGAPPPAPRCPACDRVPDTASIHTNPGFRPPARLRADLSFTYDGAAIASARLREACLRLGIGGASWRDVGGGAWHLVATRVLPFDAARRGTRFTARCAACGEPADVVGATPAFLLPDAATAAPGFARTDLAFGSGLARAPLLLLDDASVAALRRERLRGIDWMPAATP